MSRRPRPETIVEATTPGTLTIPSEQPDIDLLKLQRLTVDLEVRQACADALRELLFEARDSSRFANANTRSRITADWDDPRANAPMEDLALLPAGELRALNLNRADIEYAISSVRRVGLIESSQARIVGDIAALRVLVGRLQEHAGLAAPTGVFGMSSALGFKG